MLKQFFLSTLVILLTWQALPAQKVHPVWDPRYRSGIAAEVEDRIITYQDVWREIEPIEPQIRAESMTQGAYEDKMKQLYTSVLHQLIDNILILKDFEAEGMQIPPHIIENRFNDILIERFGNDRQRLIEHLQNYGKTLSEYRKSIKEEMIVMSMRAEQREKVAAVSPERIEEFYNENKIHFFQEEQVHLRLILLKALADESLDLLQQQAEKIVAELDNGGGFAELAKQHSQDARKNKGGDWGWITRSELRDELTEAAFSLEPGGHTKPITLDEHIYILGIDAKKPEGVKPLNEVREEIENTLATQITRQANKRWLERLRKDAFIKYY